jgi:hypothetical protein
MRFDPIALAFAALVLAPTAFAAASSTSSTSSPTTTIAGLNNTGAGLAADVQDKSYLLSVTGGSTTGLGAYGYVADMKDWPDNGPWLNTEASTSKWLTPTAGEAQNFDPSSDGTYSWTLSFNLTGYDPASASFAGRWAADNYGVVKLNGTQIGSAGGFANWSSFAANSGFNAGVNTLEFLVTNTRLASGNPTGLRVEYLSSSVAAVPEPETYAMLMAGLGLLGAVARRRKAIRSAA